MNTNQSTKYSNNSTSGTSSRRGYGGSYQPQYKSGRPTLNNPRNATYGVSTSAYSTTTTSNSGLPKRGGGTYSRGAYAGRQNYYGSGQGNAIEEEREGYEYNNSQYAQEEEASYYREDYEEKGSNNHHHRRVERNGQYSTTNQSSYQLESEPATYKNKRGEEQYSSKYQDEYYYGKDHQTGNTSTDYAVDGTHDNNYEPEDQGRKHPSRGGRGTTYPRKQINDQQQQQSYPQQQQQRTSQYQSRYPQASYKDTTKQQQTTYYKRSQQSNYQDDAGYPKQQYSRASYQDSYSNNYYRKDYEDYSDQQQYPKSTNINNATSKPNDDYYDEEQSKQQDGSEYYKETDDYSKKKTYGGSSKGGDQVSFGGADKQTTQYRYQPKKQNNQEGQYEDGAGSNHNQSEDQTSQSQTDTKKGNPSSDQDEEDSQSMPSQPHRRVFIQQNQQNLSSNQPPLERIYSENSSSWASIDEAPSEGNSNLQSEENPNTSADQNNQQRQTTGYRRADGVNYEDHIERAKQELHRNHPRQQQPSGNPGYRYNPEYQHTTSSPTLKAPPPQYRHSHQQKSIDDEQILEHNALIYNLPEPEFVELKISQSHQSGASPAVPVLSQNQQSMEEQFKGMTIDGSRGMRTVHQVQQIPFDKQQYAMNVWPQQQQRQVIHQHLGGSDSHVLRYASPPTPGQLVEVPPHSGEGGGYYSHSPASHNNADPRHHQQQPYLQYNPHLLNQDEQQYYSQQPSLYQTSQERSADPYLVPSSIRDQQYPPPQYQQQPSMLNHNAHSFIPGNNNFDTPPHAPSPRSYYQYEQQQYQAPPTAVAFSGGNKLNSNAEEFIPLKKKQSAYEMYQGYDQISYASGYPTQQDDGTYYEQQQLNPSLYFNRAAPQNSYDQYQPEEHNPGFYSPSPNPQQLMLLQQQRSADFKPAPTNQFIPQDYPEYPRSSYPQSYYQQQPNGQQQYPPQQFSMQHYTMGAQLQEPQQYHHFHNNNLMTVMVDQDYINPDHHHSNEKEAQ